MMKPYVLLASYLVALLSCTLLSGYLYINQGLSAAWLLIILITLALFGTTFNLFKRQQRQAELVIRALANGDNTLGLSHHHPMRQQFEQVKQQMQNARFNAEQQAQFLQALLIHVDLAVLVCDNNGHVIESNPAVSKLLGQNIKHMQELGAIGDLIINSDKNLRSTSQWRMGEQLDTLSIQLSIATIQGKTRRVVSFQSIHEQLQHKEQQAYKRLTQVLTHEIANSITPLSSLAQTCSNLLPNSLNFSDEENKQDLQLALQTIASRTQHLGDFISRFRQVSNLPKPNLSPTDLAPMLTRIIALFQQQAVQQGIILTLNINSHQLVMLDSGQIEQVLINLVKNALEALNLNQQHANANTKSKSNDNDNENSNANSRKKSALKPEIKLTLAQNQSQQLYVEVTDNGSGIAEHVIDMIFVPFFSTKQQGSGIGLSLSHQIMLNHGGNLIYITKPSGATFRCVFG